MLANEIIICVPNFDFVGIKILKLHGVKKVKLGFSEENQVFYFNKTIIKEMLKDNDLNIVGYASTAPRKLVRLYNQIIEIDSCLFA